MFRVVPKLGSHWNDSQWPGMTVTHICNLHCADMIIGNEHGFQCRVCWAWRLSNILINKGWIVISLWFIPYTEKRLIGAENHWLYMSRLFDCHFTNVLSRTIVLYMIMSCKEETAATYENVPNEYILFCVYNSQLYKNLNMQLLKIQFLFYLPGAKLSSNTETQMFLQIPKSYQWNPNYPHFDFGCGCLKTISQLFLGFFIEVPLNLALSHQ